MSEPDLLGVAPSTLKRPAAKFLRSFRTDMIFDRHTVRYYLAEGFSLGICCKDCKRLTEWTPAELQRRFGTKLDLRIRDIAERIKCAGAGGCGSSDVAVWPHLFDGVWARTASPV
jgi:hypothetical protein